MWDVDADRDPKAELARAAAPWHRRWRWRAAIAVGVLLCLLLLVRPYALPSYVNEGEAMTPTLDDGQRFVANRWTSPDIGDVVIVDSTSSVDGARRLVKRVVAVGGDTIAYLDCRIVRNGEPVDEPYDTIDAPCVGDFAEITVPDDTLFVVGDNRPGSSDSRFFGPVPTGDVKGVLWLTL
jgi:signal peptidase I